MENYDVIVVGAGISGMSFAHYATKAGFKTLGFAVFHDFYY
jgi:flavin-dependent dehydrogenase